MNESTGADKFFIFFCVLVVIFFRKEPQNQEANTFLCSNQLNWSKRNDKENFADGGCGRMQSFYF